MKKAILSLLFIVGFGAYAFYNYASGNNSSNTAPVVLSDSAGSPASTPDPTPAAPAPVKTVPAVVPVKKPTGQYVDGMYVGDAADAYYGNVQVKITISGGKLTNVAFLQYPTDRSTSRYINQQAMPVLRQEAIRAQSARVDGVSGASDSSAAFQQSLASALAQAKA